MTPAQFKEARHALGLSVARLARILNVDPRTVRRWEADDGTRPPNPIACRVMEWLAQGFTPPQQENHK